MGFQESFAKGIVKKRGHPGRKSAELEKSKKIFSKWGEEVDTARNLRKNKECCRSQTRIVFRKPRGNTWAEGSGSEGQSSGRAEGKFSNERKKRGEVDLGKRTWEGEDSIYQVIL